MSKPEFSINAYRPATQEIATFLIDQAALFHQSSVTSYITLCIRTLKDVRNGYTQHATYLGHGREGTYTQQQCVTTKLVVRTTYRDPDLVAFMHDETRLFASPIAWTNVFVQAMYLLVMHDDRRLVSMLGVVPPSPVPPSPVPAPAPPAPAPVHPDVTDPVHARLKNLLNR